MATTSSDNTETNNLKIITIDANKMDHKNEKEEDEEKYYTYAYQLVNFSSLPMVMNVIVNMGVLQIITDHADPNGLSSEDIAIRIKISNPQAPAMLDRMLRLLATYSVVRCTTISTTNCGEERRYSPSPVTKYYVPDGDSVSLAGMLNLYSDKVFLESWTKLGDAIKGGGIPFDIVHGMSIFEYAMVDPRFNELFNNAMHQATPLVVKKILEKYKGLENIHQLVDVGGGIGHTLHLITSKYPSIKGINFDLPHVIHNALPCTGVENISGDMFEGIPEGDAIFMKWILHNWSDEYSLRLLKNCHKALPKNGKVIVVEEIMEDKVESTNASRVTSQMDLMMMAQVPGGKERNKQQFEALAKASGFANVQFHCCTYNFWVMEFYK